MEQTGDYGTGDSNFHSVRVAFANVTILAYRRQFDEEKTISEVIDSVSGSGNSHSCLHKNSPAPFQAEYRLLFDKRSHLNFFGGLQRYHTFKLGSIDNYWHITGAGWKSPVVTKLQYFFIRVDGRTKLA